MLDLSVIVCLYNAEKYICNTLRSICAQTKSDFQLVIINDCSTDKSVSVAKEYLDSVGREYTLFEFHENQGIAYARNFGLYNTTSKYIIFIDADDIPEKELVEKEYSLISSDPNLIAVTSWLRYIDANGKRINGKMQFGERTKEDFLKKASSGKRIFLPIHTIFDRIYAIKSGGFSTNGFPQGKPRYQDYCEDLDLWTRMSDFYKEGKAIVGLQEYLYNYRKIDGLSSNHFYMIIKMDYVKYNVRRRRKGLKDVTFIEYMDSLDPQYLAKLKKDSKSADDLRNSIFYLHRGNLFKALGLVFRSIGNNPTYVLEKIRHNL